MDFNSTDSVCNMPSATVSGTGSTLDLPSMSIMDDDAILRLYSSSTLALGESWSLAALLAPWTEFDFQNYAPSAFGHEVPSTQHGLCAQGHPHYSPRPVPSPTTSTESLSPFSFAHADNTISPAGYSRFAFTSLATMGQDIAFPFLVGSPSPADVIAHAAQSTTSQSLPGIFAPCSAATSLVCHPLVSSATARPVQASSTPSQGGPMRQESLFMRATTSAGKSCPSPPAFPGTLSALHYNAPLLPPHP